MSDSRMPHHGISVRAMERNIKWLEKHPAYGIDGTKKTTHEQRLKLAYRFAKAMYFNKKKESSSLKTNGAKKDPEATKKTHNTVSETASHVPVVPSVAKTGASTDDGSINLKKKCKCWLCS